VVIVRPDTPPAGAGSCSGRCRCDYRSDKGCDRGHCGGQETSGPAVPAAVDAPPSTRPGRRCATLLHQHLEPPPRKAP